jgi:DNA-directed RNA polymerase specialized sigma subunit, sigma24 homolog
MQRRTRREHLPLDAPGADLAGSESSPEAAAMAGGDVRRALARLGDDERAAIVQCYYLERSHEEAARVLGMPVGTVKSHVFRARLKLREWLGAWAPAGGGES